MLQGAVGSKDLAGQQGFLGAGDVQWLAAGKGIVHTEASAGEGENAGVHFWINLPSKDRMIEPSCVEIQSKDTTVISSDGVEVRVIAGESFGVRVPARTRTPIMFLDFRLRPVASVRQRVPEPWSAFVYAVDGEGVFGAVEASPAARHQALLLGRGDFRVRADG